jgi:hypothetical protein
MRIGVGCAVMPPTPFPQHTAGRYTTKRADREAACLEKLNGWW